MAGINFRQDTSASPKYLVLSGGGKPLVGGEAREAPRT